MKKILTFNLVLLLVSSFSCSSTKSKFPYELYQQQSKINSTYANSTRWTRNSLPDSIIKASRLCDTIFLIERIDEVDKHIKGNMWCSNNRTVFSYSNEDGTFKYSTKLIQHWNDPLQNITERFDTAAISLRKSYLGAYQVFISRITHEQINTYFFSDFTPATYFARP